MKTTHTFVEDSNRYAADDILLRKGFCQVDTAQDFEHYGNWIHLDELRAWSYVEGDLYEITFEDAAEIKPWLEKIIDLKHVDCGISNRDHNLARAAVLGISHLAA